LYVNLFGSEALFNSLLIKSDDARAIAQTLLSNENVRAVVNIMDYKSYISDSTDALGIVTIVLIIMACALALVVLFNLTNININERIRELATIKVLGFYDMELAMYIYRENAAVTLMGILAGLFGGVYLHKFILTTVEVDMLMFPQIIYPSSYVLAVALSAAFAVFVNLIMNIRLARIDMVGSLKNVE
jgi:putative ABC transport system permease protein